MHKVLVKLCLLFVNKLIVCNIMLWAGGLNHYTNKLET